MTSVTQDLLIQKRDYYREMAQMCDEVLEGNSMVKVCKDHNLSLAAFRGRMFKNDDKSKMISPAALLESLREFSTPSEKLFYDALEFSRIQIGPYSMYQHPDDFEQTVENLISELPDERMRSIICQAYYNNKTFVEIGENFNISSSRVSQIVHKALGMICRKQNFIRLMYGDTKYQEIMSGSVSKDFARKVFDHVSHALRYYKDIDEICEYVKKKLSQLQEYYHDKNIQLDDSDIEVLGLDVRTYNCLMRTRQDWTIQKLDSTSDEELLRMRNLGVTCLRNIRSRIYEYKKSLEASSSPAETTC